VVDPAGLIQAGLDRHRAGDVGAAESLYRQALLAEPGHPDAWHLAGLARVQAGQGASAVPALARARALAPDIAAYAVTSGVALRAAGRMEDALSSFAAARRLDPENAEALSGAGTTLRALGRHGEAVDAFRTALAQRPDHVESQFNLGNAAASLGRPALAATAYHHVGRMLPDHPDVLRPQAEALFLLGDVASARATQDRLVRLRPEDPDATRVGLQWDLVRDDLGAARLLADRRDWNQRFARIHVRRAPDIIDPDPERRLRLGYVGGPALFANTHARTVLPLFEHHDRVAFEIACYSDLPGRLADGATRRYRTSSDLWRETAALDDDAFAAQVRADRIDVLIDLVGHLGGPRFRVFARRPAPVQTVVFATGTSGLDGLDFTVLDARLAAPDVTRHVSETVALVDLAYLFHPVPDEPAIAPPPSQASGQVTFGSLNALAKVSDGALALWGRVLDAVPGSRMLIKGQGLEDAGWRAYWRARAARQGLDPARVELRGWAADYRGHLGVLDEIDVVLDSWPYAGVTTTCEALLMGVPVVTLTGDRIASRYGASLLGAVGLGDLVAENDPDYVAIASSLATDKVRRSELRGTLRRRLRASPLADPRRFARAYEAAYRGMWRYRCTGAPGTAILAPAR
jgi:predicted O-linked N-acetylglucosamine transferase (SPINDLY family)